MIPHKSRFRLFLPCSRTIRDHCLHDNRSRYLPCPRILRKAENIKTRQKLVHCFSITSNYSVISVIFFFYLPSLHCLAVHTLQRTNRHMLMQQEGASPSNRWLSAWAACWTLSPYRFETWHNPDGQHSRRGVDHGGNAVSRPSNRWGQCYVSKMTLRLVGTDSVTYHIYLDNNTL